MTDVNITEIKKLFHNLKEDVNFISTMLMRVHGAVSLAEITVIELDHIVDDHIDDEAKITGNDTTH